MKVGAGDTGFDRLTMIGSDAMPRILSLSKDVPPGGISR
jgi:hypothetical protein